MLCIMFMTSTLYSLWCHQMETFSAQLALCEGNSSVTGEFPHKVPRSFYAFSDRRLNKRDLRRHRAHCEVTVMEHHIWSSTLFNRLQLMFMDGCLNIQSHFNTCGASAFRISMSIFPYVNLMLLDYACAVLLILQRALQRNISSLEIIQLKYAWVV